jgi:hypothetical protein
MAEPKTRTRPKESDERRPWRVEGERQDPAKRDGPPGRGSRLPRPPGSRRFWQFLLVLLVLNIILGQLIPTDEDERLDVPYTFFRAQVIAGNV